MFCLGFLCCCCGVWVFLFCFKMCVVCLFAAGFFSFYRLSSSVVCVSFFFSVSFSSATGVPGRSQPTPARTPAGRLRSEPRRSGPGLGGGRRGVCSAAPPGGARARGGARSGTRSGAARGAERAAPPGLEAAERRRCAPFPRCPGVGCGKGGTAAPRPGVARGGAGSEAGPEGRWVRGGPARREAGGAQPAALRLGDARRLRAEFGAEFQVFVLTGCLHTSLCPGPGECGPFWRAGTGEQLWGCLGHPEPELHWCENLT